MTAVASDVDQRYISRYGPVLGAAFVAGFGQAAAQVGTTQSQSSSSTTVTQAAPSTAQALAAGVSSAASSVAGDLLSHAPKGALISLAADYPMAVLFVDGVFPPGSAESEQVGADNAAAALKVLGAQQRGINGQNVGDASSQASSQVLPQQQQALGYQGQTGMRVYPAVPVNSGYPGQTYYSGTASGYPATTYTGR
jgi:hypothetical protein